MNELDPSGLIIGQAGGDIVRLNARFEPKPVVKVSGAVAFVHSSSARVVAMSEQGRLFDGAKQAAIVEGTPVALTAFGDGYAVALARSAVTLVDAQLAFKDGFDCPGETLTGMVAAGDRLIVATAKGHLLALDPGRGAFSSFVSAAPRADETPHLSLRWLVACGAYVVCATNGGRVLVYDTRDLGKAPGSVALAQTRAAALAVLGQSVLALSERGELFAIDPASATRQALAGQLEESALQMCARDGALFVLSGSALTAYRLPDGPGERVTKERRISLREPRVMTFEDR